ncbi:MAG: aminopeptidase P family protein [Thermovirgaceae bacterium]
MVDLERIRKVVERMEPERIDALFVSVSPDLEYLTGLTPIDDERFKGICIYPDRRLFALAPTLCLEEFKEDLGEEIDIFVWADNEGPSKAMSLAFQKYGVPKVLGVNDSVRAADILPIAAEHNIELRNARRVVATVRMEKSQEEIDRLRKTGTLADEVLRQLVGFIEPGLTERKLQLKLRDVYESLGGEKISYVACAGPNSALPHYNRSSGIIQKQDVVLIDFGGSYGGYRSDTTRTFFVGEPTEEQRKVYDIVLEAHLAGEAAVREGIRACDIDHVVRGVIEKSGYGEFFTHRTGHGIGIVAHELPDISSADQTVLKKGMAFSIEPGIYLPGRFGIRIENCVTVTDDGALSFTSFPRELISL